MLDSTMTEQVLVAIIMGSKSDWPTMERTADMLDSLGIKNEAVVISAHRTPDKLIEYVSAAEQRGIEVVIAGAGGAAHLPGVTAAMTLLPVIGVPIKSSTLDGLDSLLSIVQMPAGIPVATMAVGNAGATNAALQAASILGVKYPEYRAALKQFRAQRREALLADMDPRA
jgi:5-(carboxyamino)imidazole ribonucleotide mutase